MQKYKLILKRESFYEDLVFTLKILATINGDIKNHDVLLILDTSEINETKLRQLLSEENLEPEIIITNKKEIANAPLQWNRYHYIFTNIKIDITEIKNLQKVIFLAEFPCPKTLLPLPHFNAAATPARNYFST